MSDPGPDSNGDRILQAALALFARHGFATTSVRTIAEAAGVSQGVLYNYYESKHALLRALFERSMAEVRENIQGAARAPTPAAALEHLVRTTVETVRRGPDYWRVSYQVRMQPEVLAGLGDTVAMGAELIRARFEELLRAVGAADADLRARVLFAALDGAAQHYVLDPENYPFDAVADEMLRIFVPGGGAA